MVRSLYSAAAGMMAQQTSVDVIANNLANVNTVGYKAESTEFKSLLYQNLQSKTTSANGEQKPVSAQVGLGARVASITSHYTEGSAQATDSNTDFMINGDGFFAVQNTSGQTVYTRMVISILLYQLRALCSVLLMAIQCSQQTVVQFSWVMSTTQQE